VLFYVDVWIIFPVCVSIYSRIFLNPASMRQTGAGAVS